MKTSLVIVAVSVASVAFATRCPVTPAGSTALRQQAVTRFVDLPLGRAAWTAVPFTIGDTLTYQLPATQGFALSRINVNRAGVDLQIVVNGNPVSGIVFLPSFSTALSFEMGPPVLLHPGDIVSVVTSAPPSSGGPGGAGVLYYGGWHLLPGEI